MILNAYIYFNINMYQTLPIKTHNIFIFWRDLNKLKH